MCCVIEIEFIEIFFVFILKIKKRIVKKWMKGREKIYFLVYIEYFLMNWIYNIKKNLNFIWKYFVRLGSIFNIIFILNLLKLYEDFLEYSS